MKRSMAAGAGYLVIDHSNSPGISAADAARLGILAAPGGTVLERDTVTCAHCHCVVVLNPERVRARATCLKCASYICDGCEAIRVAMGGACLPFERVLERAQELLVRYAGQPDHPALAALGRLSLLAVPDPARIVVPHSV
jgi:hypothetical protein